MERVVDPLMKRTGLIGVGICLLPNQFMAQEMKARKQKFLSIVITILLSLIPKEKLRNMSVYPFHIAN